MSADTNVMRQALENIANPLAYLRREAEAKGHRLSEMAYQIANDPEFIKSIARDALAQPEQHLELRERVIAFLRAHDASATDPDDAGLESEELERIGDLRCSLATTLSGGNRHGE
jgi:hypothetical protein